MSFQPLIFSGILVGQSSGGGGGGVTSLNGLSGSVSLVPGSNVTITPSGQTLIIAATGGGTFFKQNITLTSGDITNQYVNLSHLTIPYSVTLAVDKAYQVEGDDYILSTVGGVTRLTFNNALASGGVSALVSGDILNLQYSY